VSTYEDRVGTFGVETRSAEEIWNESQMFRMGWGACMAPGCTVWSRGRDSVIVRRKHPSGDVQKDHVRSYCSEECAKLATTVENVSTQEEQ